MLNRLNHGSFQHATTRIRRAVLSLLIAGSMLGAVTADEIAPSKSVATPAKGGISIFVHQYDADAHLPFVDFPTTAKNQTALGTHDSMPIVPVAKSVTRTSSTYSEMVSSLIATTAIQAGIPIQPILEPFAMVRTIRSKPAIAPESSREAEIDQIVSEVTEFNRWWLGEPELDFDAAMKELAKDEPLDVQNAESIGHLFVGSGPMIATIEEPYQPYDLADSDLGITPIAIDVFQPVPKPASFVPGYYVLSPQGRDAMALPEEPHQTEFASVAQVSPDCFLDELIWDAATWAERSSMYRWNGTKLGRALGDWVISGHTRQIQWMRSIVLQLPSMIKGNNAPRGELKLAEAFIPEPVADPLPDADPEVFDTAMFLLSEPSEPLVTVLLPVPDQLPHAELSDYANEIELVSQFVARIQGGLLQGWTEIAMAMQANAPEEQVAQNSQKPDDF